MLNPEFIRDPETLRRFRETCAAFAKHVLPIARAHGITDTAAATLFLNGALGEAVEALTAAADAIVDAAPANPDDDDEPWKR